MNINNWPVMFISGLMLCIGGVFIAIWLGGWVFFIGGIVQIVESVKAEPVSGLGIFMGVIRWWLCWPAFWVALVPVVGTGVHLIRSS